MKKNNTYGGEIPKACGGVSFYMDVSFPISDIVYENLNARPGGVLNQVETSYDVGIDRSLGGMITVPALSGTKLIKKSNPSEKETVIRLQTECLV